jgi:hypothetical protein
MPWHGDMVLVPSPAATFTGWAMLERSESCAASFIGRALSARAHPPEGGPRPYSMSPRRLSSLDCLYPNSGLASSDSAAVF